MHVCKQSGTVFSVATQVSVSLTIRQLFFNLGLSVNICRESTANKCPISVYYMVYIQCVCAGILVDTCYSGHFASASISRSLSTEDAGSQILFCKS